MINNAWGILFSMIFLHIVDDYYLQKGLLAFMKQKSWWREDKNYKDLYKFDYIVGLIVHSFSWSFMIMLPITFFLGLGFDSITGILFIVNMIIHAVIDDLKANRGKINLIVDQLIHLIQIIVTFFIVMGSYKIFF